MTGRLYAALGVLGVTGLSALSLGGPVYHLFSWTLLLMILYSLLSVLLARGTSMFTQALDSPKTDRGGEGVLTLGMRCKSPLPAGPVQVLLTLPQGRTEAGLRPGFLRERRTSLPLRFPHVGVWTAGADTLVFTDVFGMFRIPRKAGAPLPEMAVLPLGFQVQPLAFAAMDDGRALPNRSGEDLTSPEDVRPWRAGDPFKRIHWKLSSRNRELLVRRFEVPAPPDTLILMDCTDPAGGEDMPDGALRLRDTLCETALAAAAMQMAGGQPVRVPLYGARRSEFHADRTGLLPLLKEELAYQLFRGGEPFHRVLALELRRTRRTGAAVVITTRLDAAVVQGVNDIRACGPSVRFYLVTFTPEAERYEPLILQLQQRLVEVCYVTPP